MAIYDAAETPTTAEFLVGFTDLREFLSLAKELETSRKLFEFLDDLAGRMSAVVENSGGRILKFIGDASLVVFSGEDADVGVRSLLKLKEVADSFIADKGFPSRLKVSAHYGEATIGPFGPEARLDILGETVNRAAMVERGPHRSEFAITPEVFRRLKPETRTLFREFTPPVVYLAKEASNA